MHIFVIGVNHQSAPVALRERLAFRSEDLPAVFSQLRQEAGVQESAILSTCNRVEIYARVPDTHQTPEQLQMFLSRRACIDAALLGASVYRYAEPHSVQHLFSVASGLDSMVLGEGEILGQVKHAYACAKTHGGTGRVLNALFQKAINAAKAVRTQTGIGRGHASVGTVAVDLAEKIFGTLRSQLVLLAGAGEIGELTLKHLLSRGVSQVRVINRTAGRARDLAAAYGALAANWETMSQQLVEADIVIASTASAQPVLGLAAVAAAMRSRHQRPLCLVDLGVPRNIEPSAGELENVYLFNIDDLKGLVAQSVRRRQAAVNQSRAIIDRKVEHFLSWWRSDPACGSSWERAAAR
jgi:glutamyl-tRNA reductase